MMAKFINANGRLLPFVCLELVEIRSVSDERVGKSNNNYDNFMDLFAALPFKF